MPLTSPNLDDRTFAQLVADAKAKIPEWCPAWTDRSASDPGIVLLELFAFLTETLIYRINRIPEKAYIEFLRLLGVSLRPPGAASATLQFAKAVGKQVEVPRGTRVTTQRPSGDSVAPVFVTVNRLVLEEGAAQGEVLAVHCEEIHGELAAIATGLPGLAVYAKRPPLIAPTGDDQDLLVGVETLPEEVSTPTRTTPYESKTYRIWREVEHFANLGPDRRVYVVDRSSGWIQFAPALGSETASASASPALGEVPPAGREIRLWYRRGGGAEGNVPADSLTVLKESLTGVRVTNPRAAGGGRAAESIESALVRGPQELHSLERAVTARDYEMVALGQGGVSRANATTKAALWRHAAAGTVHVVLVPAVPGDPGRIPITSSRLEELASEEVLDRTRRAIEQRRPLGTRIEVSWVHTKTVRVRGRVVAYAGEDLGALLERLQERVNTALSPIPSPQSPRSTPGWRFGEPLRIAHVYLLLQSEPGVRYADGVALVVDEVPREVTTVAADPFEANVWYAGADTILYRSVNSGDGWEPAGVFPDERIKLVCPHPQYPGLLAVLTAAKEGSRAHVSRDCGEHWESLGHLAFTAEDAAWITREGAPVLLMASDVGLYELAATPGSVPNQILVDPADQTLGFYSVAVSFGALGGISVAVAARERGGIYLSSDRGRPETFRPVGLNGEDIRLLAIQTIGPNSFLWAGIAAPGEVGRGCFRAQLWEAGDAPLEWLAFSKGWDGGTCRSLAFDGSRVFAGTQFQGVTLLDAAVADPAWKVPGVESRLPIKALSIFEEIPAVATDPSGTWRMAATRRGIYRARGEADAYEPCSDPTFTDRVTLPANWLFCAGNHEIEVVHEPTA